MKIMRNLLVGLVAALWTFTALAQDNEAAKQDQARLQGEWTMVSGERDGQAFAAGLLKGSKRVAKGDETMVTVQGQLMMKARFTLDPAKQPKAIDYAVTGGPHAGAKQLGIYELDGDTAKFCFATPGNERPTAFTTQPDDGRTLSVWQRKQN